MNHVAATFFLNPPARRPHVGPSLLGRLLGRLDAAEGRRQLHGLSDHVLRDVGLRRDQIDDALRGSVHRQANRLRQLGG